MGVDCLAPLVIIYIINYVVMCMRPKMAIGIRVHKVEPMLGDWS